MGTSYQFRWSKYIVREPGKPSPEDFSCPPDWRAKSDPWTQVAFQKFVSWFGEQTVLIEAFWVAVTFHVLIFPLIWFVGWALPWPKPPQITTVIEINLEHWPEDARPERIQELYNYKLNEARHAHK